MFRSERVIVCASHDSDVVCVKCAPEEDPEDIRVACDAVLASVEDRRENGGASTVIRSKTISLIATLVGSLAR